MREPIQIENIEAMRCQQGIDDVELRQAIRGLRVGDVVRLTVLAPERPFPGQPLLMRITHISGVEFRGKVAQPTVGGLPGLKSGAALTFHADHIHSIPKQ